MAFEEFVPVAYAFVNFVLPKTKHYIYLDEQMHDHLDAYSKIKAVEEELKQRGAILSVCTSLAEVEQQIVV